MNSVAVPAGVAFTATTMVNVPVTLTTGRNKVCAVADNMPSSSGNDVALECIDVVVVP